MGLNDELVNAQRAELALHRQRLAFRLQERAKLGVYTPPYVLIDIQEAQSAIGRIKEQLRAHGVVIGDEPNDDVQPAAVTAPSRLSLKEQRNRSQMLAKVKSIWIEGLLEHSLAKELRIALDLTEQPDAVDLPLNAIVQELHHPPRVLPPGTPIITVFERMAGALLILGAPGAGKTTLLLELARDLIARAEQDEGHAIPVVFNLSSWAEKRRPLKEWLVEELNRLYEVPRKLAEAWIDEDLILPLLDGLDEVAAGQRIACVAAINTYREEHGLVPLTVCSRVADYEAVSTKLRLRGAVVVQRLTPPQAATYFEQAGEKLAGVRAALRENRELAELLTTPLMLSIATLAYAGKDETELQGVVASESWQRHLFDTYILRMFNRRSKKMPYVREQSLHWLSRLARQMVQGHQSVFYIERMQPNWLPQRQHRWYTFQVSLLCGLLAGLLGLLITLVGGLLLGVVVGVEGFIVAVFLGIFVLGNGSISGLISGLGCVLRESVDLEEITSIERLEWSSSKFRSAFVDTFNKSVDRLNEGLPVLSVLLISGLLISVVSFGADALVIGLSIVIIGLLGWTVYALFYGMRNGLVNAWKASLVAFEIKVITKPNQGIHLTTRNLSYILMYDVLPFWVLGVLLAGLVGTLVLLQGGDVSVVVDLIGLGLLVGLVSGMFVYYQQGRVLIYGGRTVLQHYTLRWMLYRNGSLPLRLIPFLDHCVDRIFLRRIGGGYIFIHRLLMEHFAGFERGMAE